MEVAFRLVDVFTERPFAGNQLCVVPDSPAELASEQMQTLAREIGFSETTFVTSSGGDRYTVRIFTPVEELPFAGHPTLGTAFVMVSEGRVSSPVVQTSPAGEVPVEIDAEAGNGWMTQLPAEFGAEFDDRDLLARALRLSVDDLHPELPAQVVSTGLGPLLVPVQDEAALRRAVNDMEVTREACQRSGGYEIYAFAIRGDGDVMARFFDPFGDIGEDPATGSAAGPLGAYLAARNLAGMPGTAIVSQGEMVGRPSELHLDVREDGDGYVVRVGGGVQVIGAGTFRVTRDRS
jgi:trans-2,3-dihydro-3-hydroxyanthranilate isomerase